MLAPWRITVLRLDLNIVSIDLRLRGREFPSPPGNSKWKTATARGNNNVDIRLGETIERGRAKLRRWSV